MCAAFAGMRSLPRQHISTGKLPGTVPHHCAAWDATGVGGRRHPGAELRGGRREGNEEANMMKTISSGCLGPAIRPADAPLA